MLFSSGVYNVYCILSKSYDIADSVFWESSTHNFVKYLAKLSQSLLKGVGSQESLRFSSRLLVTISFLCCRWWASRLVKDMTVTYTAEVATCRGFGCFLKLLIRLVQHFWDCMLPRLRRHRHSINEPCYGPCWRIYKYCTCNQRKVVCFTGETADFLNIILLLLTFKK